MRGDKCGADVGQVCAHRLGCQYGTAGGNRAAQHQRTVKPLANFLHHGKRAFHTGVAACTGCHRDQPGCAFFNGLVGKHVADHVVQRDAAPGFYRHVHVFTRTQAGDDDGHFVFFTHRHVVLQAVIALVHDLVDGIRRGWPVWVRRVVRSQSFRNFCQPVFQLRSRARVQRGHRANHACNALRNHQLGVADDEQRRANHGERQVLKNRWQF